MVFLIQNTQNRDTKAIHLKLDELIRSISTARNSLVCLERLSHEEIDPRAPRSSSRVFWPRGQFKGSIFLFHFRPRRQKRRVWIEARCVSAFSVRLLASASRLTFQKLKEMVGSRTAQPFAYSCHDRINIPASRRGFLFLTSAAISKWHVSSHAYVRGNTEKFYEWLNSKSAVRLPQGPPGMDLWRLSRWEPGPDRECKGRY